MPHRLPWRGCAAALFSQGTTVRAPGSRRLSPRPLSGSRRAVGAPVPGRAGWPRPPGLNPVQLFAWHSMHGFRCPATGMVAAQPGNIGTGAARPFRRDGHDPQALAHRDHTFRQPGPVPGAGGGPGSGSTGAVLFGCGQHGTALRLCPMLRNLPGMWSGRSRRRYVPGVLPVPSFDPPPSFRGYRNLGTSRSKP